MEQTEIKKFIAEQLSKGVSLTDIQKLLSSEKGVVMTFLELRLLASEIENVDWAKQNKEESKPKDISPDKLSGKAPPDDEEVFADEEDGFENEHDEAVMEGEPVSSGKTTVEMNKIARPGAIASGSVNFGSGAKAEWILDSLGRVGLDKAQGKPTPQDVQEFQMELQKLLSRGV